MSAAIASERLLTLMREPVVPDVGVHPHVSFAEYHGWDALSNSRMSRLKKSAAHLRAYLDGLTDDDTSAKASGRAFHCAVLEPDVFPSRYLASDQCEAITKEKKRCSKQGSIYSGTLGWLCGTHGTAAQGDRNVTIVPANDYTKILKMRDAVYAHSKARVLLTTNAQHEMSLVWCDKESGVLCKARHDSHTPSVAGGAIVDLKQTRDASLRGFERAVYAYGYQRQAFHYLDGSNVLGIPAEHFVNIAVEPEPPFAVGVYRMNEAAIEAGGQEVRSLRKRYAECLATNAWPGYSEQIEDVALPAYAWGEIDHDTRDIE